MSFCDWSILFEIEMRTSASLKYGGLLINSDLLCVTISHNHDIKSHNYRYRGNYTFGNIVNNSA